jgi:hypothetical protein
MKKSATMRDMGKAVDAAAAVAGGAGTGCLGCQNIPPDDLAMGGIAGFPVPCLIGHESE